MRWFYLTLFSVAFCSEPMATDVEGAALFNESIIRLKDELRENFELVTNLSKQDAKDEDYQALLSKVSLARKKIRNLEEEWRRSAVQEVVQDSEGYAMWDVGETTLSQLIMEYGASDFLYVIPQELSGMKISLFSGIPLPHESWAEMIEMILSQNGIGVKRVNSFVKQLYILKLDPSAIEAVVAKETDLSLFSNHARITYLLSPPPSRLSHCNPFLRDSQILSTLWCRELALKLRSSLLKRP